MLKHRNTMKQSRIFLLSSLFAATFLFAACKKDELVSEPTPAAPAPSPAPVAESKGFKANVMMPNATPLVWMTTPAMSNSNAPVAGVDYFANRGGINPAELTLMSFGNFAGDTTNASGRLTIFLSSVSDTGTYAVGGSTANSAVFSSIVGNSLAHYSTDSTHLGSVYISKYDTVNNVFSGTFGFQVHDNGAAITISGGVFTDVPFKQ